MENIQPMDFLLLFSVIIILSYVSNLLQARTKIPDLIWLIGFGVVLGPVLGVVDKTAVLQIAPLIGVISISIITLESGIYTEIEVFRDILLKAFALTLTTFIVISAGIGIISSLLIPELGLLKGLLLGTMVSGLSTVSIISIMDQLKRTYQTLNLQEFYCLSSLSLLIL